MFYLETRFIRTKPGSLCSDEGLSPVLDRDTCRAAALFVQDNYHKNVIDLSQGTLTGSCPNGCTVWEGIEIYIYFTQNSTDCRSIDYGQLCYMEGK